MSTEPFQIDGVKVAVPDPHDLSLNGTTASPPHDAGASRRPGDQVLLSGSEPRYGSLIQQKSQINVAASAFRRSDGALRALGQKIGALKAPLETIVKTYPPYAPRDQARVKLLRQYAGIRKEIDALTVPRAPDPQKTGHLPEHLPAALAADATDSQINDHLQQLDAAAAAVTDVRQALASLAMSVAERATATGRFNSGNSRDAGVHAAPATDAAAREKSLEVGQQIASVGQGVGIGPSRFLRTLG